MKTRLRGVKENLAKKDADEEEKKNDDNKKADKKVENKRATKKQQKEEESQKKADKENELQKNKISDQSPADDKPLKKKATIPKKGSKKPDDDSKDDKPGKADKEDKDDKNKKARGSRARSKSKDKSDDEDGNKAQKKEDKEPAKLVTAILKGGRAVDSLCPIRDKVHVYGQGNKFYDSTLNQSNVSHNNNKFYIIQVLQMDNNQNQFYTWNRWGRVGVAGQNALKGPMGMDAAIRDYESKLHDKTVRGDYRILDIVMEEETKDDDEKDNKKDDKSKDGSDEQKKTESKLPKPVQDLINLIFDMKMMNQQMKEIGYDAKKMPLGKLSKSNIERGYKILADIVEALKGHGANKRSVLESLSNDFYSYIPHDVGFQKMQAFILDNNDKVKKKLEMLQSLSDIQIATKLLEEVRKADNQIDSNYEKLGCKIVPVDPKSKTHEIVSEFVRNTHAATHSNYSLEIVDLFEVEREDEVKRYKSEINNKMLLWHGSRLTNWVGILSQGLRIAPPEAPVTGYMFGKGVYFADMVSKSANYCFTTRENNVSCMLLCEVALGNMNEKLHADYNAANLPPNKHSTKGCGSTAPPAKSYIDLNGVQVPIGKGEPTPFQGALMYNEFIVYDVAQIKMKYLMKMRFKYK